MSETQTPSGIAAATKVALDSVKTPFGAAILVLFFFGLALLGLAFGGGGNLIPETRGNIIYSLISLMVIILIIVFALRIGKPAGLTAPPLPETKDITISNTESFPEK